MIDVASGGQDGGSETDGGQGGGSGTSGGEGGDGGESRPESVEGLWVAGLAPGTLTDAAQAALGAFPMASAGESLWIPLTASSFLWNGGDENAAHPRDDAPVRLSQLTQATVDVAWSEHSEVSVVKWVGLGERDGRAGIRVELAAVILSLDEVSFSLDLWLTHAGQSGEKTGIAGAVRAEVLEPDAGTGWLDISGGQAVWPASDIAGIALYLGEGVTLRISLRQGEGYCGVAVCDSAPDPQQMPGLLRVYSLYVLGLSQADSVLIESAPDSGVYDAGGNYLGAASSPLPFRDRYFLCDRKEQGSITTIGSSGISSGGGASSSSRGRDESYPQPATAEAHALSGPNAYDNPGTDRCPETASPRKTRIRTK